MDNKHIKLNVPVLTRVEGEGGLEVSIENQEIVDVKLNIFEPPRLFEKFLEGRHYSEVPDIVARICGICPIAYQMSAVQAFEALFECNPDDWVNQMRRLFYFGEWIESHSLHIHLLAAPDFFGFDSAIDMAKQFPAEVKRGIELQNIGNEIIKFLGARSVHPVGAKIGGFHHAPSIASANELREKISRAKTQAEALINWINDIDLPDQKQMFTSVALVSNEEYPIIATTLASDQGLGIHIKDYEQYFSEHQLTHSTALHSFLNDKPYLVGPLARINLNKQRLSSISSTPFQTALSRFPSENMFDSILARAVEIYFSLNEAESILKNYKKAEKPFSDITVKEGIAIGCTEAPRGILWHKYEVDKQGLVQSAKIVPPTSQNQARIEEDLRLSLTEFGLGRNDDDLQLHAEKVIRNYDPCISCATHFLDLRVNRQ